VFGSSLKLPGQFLASEDPPPEFYEKLARSVATFEPAPLLHNTSEGSLPPKELPEALMAAPMVFIRRDGPKRPLEAMYDGLYVVLQRARNVFKIQVGPRQELVSTSRLKPAFLGEVSNQHSLHPEAVPSESSSYLSLNDVSSSGGVSVVYVVVISSKSVNCINKWV
jgi:hypothetical protein